MRNEFRGRFPERFRGLLSSQPETLPQSELAEKLGVRRQSVSHWKTGNMYPSLDNVIEIARIFDVSIGWLVGVENSKGDFAANKPIEGDDSFLANLCNTDDVELLDRLRHDENFRTVIRAILQLVKTESNGKL
jgi:transcriptional regulator with XRE-family HTH domain